MKTENFSPRQALNKGYSEKGIVICFIRMMYLFNFTGDDSILSLEPHPKIFWTTYFGFRGDVQENIFNLGCDTLRLQKCPDLSTDMPDPNTTSILTASTCFTCRDGGVQHAVLLIMSVVEVLTGDT